MRSRKRRRETGAAIDAFLLLLPGTLLLAVLWSYLLLRRKPSSFLPPQRRRAVPWDGVQVLALALAVLILCPAFANWVLRSTPLLSRVYGADFLDALGANEKSAEARYQIWLQVFAFPLRLAAIAALVVKFSHAHLLHLGLSGRRLRRDMLLGVFSFCALAPLTYVANGLLGLLWRTYVMPPVEHPLEQISQSQPLVIDWVLIFFSAVVVAAVWEELFFRGVLQPWFASRWYGGDIAMGVSVAAAAALSGPPVYKVIKSSAFGLPLLNASALVLFALLMVPVYLLLRRRLRSATANAIFGTGLLFGVAHSGMWPSPVPLFLFGLGLGLLAYRTQSLVPSIVVHGLFNGVSSVALLAQSLNPANGQ